jgi:hypothetical protein
MLMASSGTLPSDVTGIAGEGVGAIKYRAAPVANINANARIFLS